MLLEFTWLISPQQEDEKAEMKDILEMKRVHEKMAKKRQAEREERLQKLENDRKRGYEMKAKEKLLRDSA